MKKCKICKTPFTPIYSTTQNTCSVQCAVKLANDKKSEDWKKRKAKLKSDLMTLQDHLKIAQMVFNKFIRLRDQGKECISCGKQIRQGNIDAGHLWSAGGHSNLRFNEYNVNAQCSRPCNKDLSGDVNNYRIGFVKRYGIEKLNEIDSLAKIEKKWTVQELKLLIIQYKQKINSIKID